MHACIITHNSTFHLLFLTVYTSTSLATVFSARTTAMKVTIDLGRLKGVRGLICGLLLGALLAVLLCLALFTAKNNDVVNLFQADICVLYWSTDSLLGGDYSLCAYVIGGSSTVLVLVAVLLCQALAVIFFAPAFTE